MALKASEECPSGIRLVVSLFGELAAKLVPALEKLIRPFVSSRLIKQEFHGTGQHRVSAFSWRFHFPVCL